MQHFIRRSACIPCLIAAILLVLPTNAELENVNTGGGYRLPESDRFVRVFYLPQGDDGKPQHVSPSDMRLVLMPGGRHDTRLWGGFSDVRVPAVPSPQKYPRHGNVALSFYFGIPQWSQEVPRNGDLIVDINGYQAFSTPLNEPGWHPRLVDLRPWAGEVVTITFRGAWTEGDPIPVVIALPRFVAWYGPHLDGRGSINTMGPHGENLLRTPGDPPINLFWSVNVDGTLIDDGPLLIERISVYRPAKLLFKSTTSEYTASLREGRYWMPLPLAQENKPRFDVFALEGEVEEGKMDIIPNFMSDDAEYLREIEAGLAVGSVESQ